MKTVLSMAVMAALAGDKANGGGGSALSPARIEAGQRAAANLRAKAGFSPEGYGKKMAEGFLAGIAALGVTWQEGVVYLLKHHNDVQQEKAMSAALKVAQEEKDETAANSLKKRISEARRIFRASREDYKATVQKMEAKGSWHQKVAAMPKATTGGRKKGGGAGKSTKAAPLEVKAIDAEVQKVIGKDADKAEVLALREVVQKAAAVAVKAEKAKAAERLEKVKGSRIPAQDVGAVVDAIKKMSFPDCRKVADVVLFHLSNSNDPHTVKAAKACMMAFDECDKANDTSLERTGTEG